ncbi:MAG: hypothetical protein R3E91_03250 [Chlamydiales bacterium]
MNYYAFSETIPVNIQAWEIKEVRVNSYALIVSYFYTYNHKNYSSKEQLDLIYPNPWAARRAIEKFQEKHSHGWIQHKIPEKSILEKKIPYKTTLSALMIWGLTIYFFFLSLFIRLKNR